MEEGSPFGITLTKRNVSPNGEKQLYVPHSVKGGLVELVDYMGSDEMVERVATAGHGRKIFPENPDQQDFINYLAINGITEPFSSVQLKFSIQSPIETALSVVYEQKASVNEYSGRYSVMLDTAYLPTEEEISSSIGGDPSDLSQRAEQIHKILSLGRERTLQRYGELIDLNLARELARIGLGTNNDTKYFWKIDLHSLACFVKKQRKLHDVNSVSRDYLECLAEVASEVAPLSWNALMKKGKNIPKINLTMPNDDLVVNGPLSSPSWDSNLTKRVTVPALEEILFVPKEILNHGEVQAVDYMGDDSAFAQAARTSYGTGTKTLQDDFSLIRSLVRDLHTSPIEMCEFSVEGKIPVFVDPRQAGRHRTLEKHGFMGYTPKGNQFYLPLPFELKYQDKKNRQGRGTEMSETEKLQARTALLQTFDSQKTLSTILRDLGTPEEVIRSQKGVGFFTKVWRTGDSHNWGHFLMLRLDSHAQKEVRDYAKVINDIHRAHTPTANQALHDYTVNGMRLSTKEIRLMESMLRSDIDLKSLDTYKGVGFVVSKKDEAGEPILEDGKKVMELGREGIDFRNKLLRMLGKFNLSSQS